MSVHGVVLNSSSRLPIESLSRYPSIFVPNGQVPPAFLSNESCLSNRPHFVRLHRLFMQSIQRAWPFVSLGKIVRANVKNEAIITK